MTRFEKFAVTSKSFAEFIEIYSMFELDFCKNYNGGLCTGCVSARDDDCTNRIVQWLNEEVKIKKKVKVIPYRKGSKG